VEFGLIQTQKGLRIYGGGILSSPDETIFAVENPQPKRLPFNAIEALRTPYRIDIKQPIYFVINDYQQLYDLFSQDLLGLVHKAMKLGDYTLSPIAL
jgi:phenylalanine-4-hydroxylase